MTSTVRRPAGVAEHTVLRRCARVHLTADDVETLGVELAVPLDWDALVDAAVDHGVGPLVHRHLDALAATHGRAVPAAARARLRAEHTYAAFRNLHLAGELRRVLAALSASGVAALPCKGPVLAADVYGDLALRRFVDLDVLVAARDFAVARDVIVALGYVSENVRTPVQRHSVSRTGHEESFVAGDDKVELQWRVADGFYGAIVTIDDLWPRRTTTTLGSTPVPTLRDDDLLLVLCIHGCGHAWDRLIWIADVAELLRRAARAGATPLDWDRVRQSARRTRAERMVRLGITLAHRLLDAPLPDEVARWAGMDPEVPRLVAEVEHELTGDATGPRSARFHLRVQEALHDKVRFALRAIFTPAPADWLAIRLPDRLYPLYRLVRPIRLLGEYGRTLLRR